MTNVLDLWDHHWPEIIIQKNKKSLVVRREYTLRGNNYNRGIMNDNIRERKEKKGER